MTKDVWITITGTQFDVGDEATELRIPGTYYNKNGKHYVMYEEQPDEEALVVKNLVKFHDGFFEMTKTGANRSVLRFEQGQTHATGYHTIMGVMEMATDTHSLTLEESENALRVNIQYGLSLSGNFVSECEVTFHVQVRE